MAENNMGTENYKLPIHRQEDKPLPYMEGAENIVNRPASNDATDAIKSQKMLDLKFIQAATRMGYSPEEVKEFIEYQQTYADYNSDQVNSERGLPTTDENMQEGGPVVLGQNPMDPPVSSPTADNLPRNLSEGEFVLPQPVVEAIGQDTLQKLSGAVEQLMGSGQDVGVVKEAIEVLVNEVQNMQQQTPQDQANQAAGIQSAAEQNSPMPPLPKPENQMNMTGGVKLPAGVGPARPNPVQ